MNNVNVAIVISNALQTVEAARRAASVPSVTPTIVVALQQQRQAIINAPFTPVRKLNPTNARRAMLRAAANAAAKSRPVAPVAHVAAPAPALMPEPEPTPVTPIPAHALQPALGIINDADLDEVPDDVRQQLERVAAQQQRRAARAEAARRVRPTDEDGDRRHKRTTRRRDMVAAA